MFFPFNQTGTIVLLTYLNEPCGTAELYPIDVFPFVSLSKTLSKYSCFT